MRKVYILTQVNARIIFTPAKKGSKPVYVDGPVYAAFRKRLEEEGWTWGITKKIESMLKEYVQGKPATGELPRLASFEITRQDADLKVADQPASKKTVRRGHR